MIVHRIIAHSASPVQALRATSRVVLWIVANPSRTLDDVAFVTQWLMQPAHAHLLLSPSHSDPEFILSLAYHMHAPSNPAQNPPARQSARPPTRSLTRPLTRRPRRGFFVAMCSCGA